MGGFTRETLQTYFTGTYTAPNLIVAAVGNTEHAQVLDETDTPIPGLYACGEMVGGLFHGNYPGGTGLMSGAVFGRIAGANAAGE